MERECCADMLVVVVVVGVKVRVIGRIYIFIYLCGVREILLDAGTG